MRKNTSPAIEKVKKKYELQWLSIEGVEGVGIGEVEGKECIMVYISQKTDVVKKEIPTEVEGYPVRFKTTGEFQAL